MNNWSIAKRIIAGGSLLLALLLIVGGVGIGALKEIESLAISRLQNDAIPGTIYMTDIGTLTLRAHIGALTAGQSTDPVQRNHALTQLAEDATAITAAMLKYEGTISVPEDRKNFAELKQHRERYVGAREAYLALVKTGKAEEAQTLAREKMEPPFLAYRDHTMMMLKWNQDSSVSATGEIVQTTHKAVLSSLIIASVSLLLALAAGWIIVRGTNRSLQQMAQVLDDASSQVASAAGQVSGSSQSLADGSSEQAASLEETSASLEELSSMTKRNADSASSAKSLSGETRQAADAGNNDMNEMRQAMDAIKTSSNDIAKIIKSIDEIAFQTNILALNAAVEAARAGEAGAGFAVVAEEVRALAQRSANSAKETASKIEIAIRNGDQGAQISAKVAQSLGVIVDKARKVDELIAEIATASLEQNHGIGQINTAVSQMDQITQSNAANAEETAAASEELSAQAITLQDTVGQLRQLVGGVPHSVTDHYTPASAPPTAKLEKLNSASLIKPALSHRTRQAPVTTASQSNDFFQDT